MFFHCFFKVFEKSCFPARDLKKHLKMSPKWTPQAAQEASRGPKMSIKNNPGFELKFRPILGRFWDPKSDPKWTPKSLKNLSWALQGPPGTPRAARRAPGSHFGAFWVQFEAIWGPILELFWSPVATLFCRSRYLLALPLLLPWRPRYSWSAGARVSAYN